MKPCKYNHPIGRYKDGHCIECARLRGETYRKTDRRKSWKAAYEATPEAKYLARARNNRHFAKPEKKMALKATKRAWQQNNKLKYRLYAQRRRALIRWNGGEVSEADIEGALKAQRGRCWWCPKIVGDEYHVDHRFPLVKGGAHDPSNIVISCAPCNRRKHDKLPWEFAWRLL